MKRNLIYQKTFESPGADNSELARWAMLDTPTLVDVFGFVWALKSQRVTELEMVLRFLIFTTLKYRRLWLQITE